MKNKKLSDLLQKSLGQQNLSNSAEKDEKTEEVEFIPDDIAEQIAGGANKGCSCPNSGCSC